MFRRLMFCGLATLLLLPAGTALAQVKHHVTLKGKFLIQEEDGKTVFKAGSRKIEVDLSKVRLQKHSVKKLAELRPGTDMTLFAKFTPWSDGDEYERMACLIAGTHYVPKHEPNSANMPTWYRGPLSFNSNQTVAYVNSATLPTGVDRAVCMIEPARVGEFYLTKKSGKKVAKVAYVRGYYTVKKDGKKKKKVFVPIVFTLPTRGIPKKEYQYILDPAKMYKDLSG